MARYTIPLYKLDELTRQINRIRNKGAQVTFEIVNPEISVSAEALGQNLTVQCAEVEVEGRYHIDGWTFVGTIEHSSPENIIRLADFSFNNRVPERYRHAGRDCEHCHIRRDRTDTYLVYNEAEDEFKQVGRTCLRGYTNGLNAETCAELASFMHEIRRIADETTRGEFSDIERYGGIRQHARYDMEIAKKQAYLYVLEHGYTAGQTGRDFADALRNNPDLPLASDQQIAEVTTWLAETRSSDYIRNVTAVWNKGNYSFRDAGYITSAVASFFKARDRAAQQAAQQAAAAETTYVGNVGDKVTFTIEECRVIYWRTGGPRFNASEYPVFRIVDTNGNVYIWGATTSPELAPGDMLTGTIKRLIERPNGEKQNELTRCKVVDSPSSRPFARLFMDN